MAARGDRPGAHPPCPPPPPSLGFTHRDSSTELPRVLCNDKLRSALDLQWPLGLRRAKSPPPALTVHTSSLTHQTRDLCSAATVTRCSRASCAQEHASRAGAAPSLRLCLGCGAAARVATERAAATTCAAHCAPVALEQASNKSSWSVLLTPSLSASVFGTMNSRTLPSSSANPVPWKYGMASKNLWR